MTALSFTSTCRIFVYWDSVISIVCIIKSWKQSLWKTSRVIIKSMRNNADYLTGEFSPAHEPLQLQHVTDQCISIDSTLSHWLWLILTVY